MRSECTTAPPATCATEIPEPSTWSGTPESIRPGSVPASVGQDERTSSWFAPMPPVATTTACDDSSKAPTTVSELGAPRATPSPRTPVTRPSVVASSVARCRKRTSTSPRRCAESSVRTNSSRSPGPVPHVTWNSWHRVAVTVREVPAPLRPLHEREPAHPLRVQPRSELAGREVHEAFGPRAREVVVVAVREVGRPEPVREGELGGVLDAQTSLLGGVDEEEPTEGPPGLATEARGWLGVEQDDSMAGRGELGCH